MKVGKRSIRRTPLYSTLERTQESSSTESLVPKDTVELGRESGIDRYGRNQDPPTYGRQQRAIAHYKRALQLKEQKTTHAPFYFEDLAPSSDVDDSSVSSSPPSSRIMFDPYRYKPTHFYPGGPDDGNALEAISPLKGVRFQRVLPNYEISTTETRESGLGPALER